ncbi:hypothetical protein VCHENC02_0974A, partial [Vibrio harveyi]
MSGVLLL